MKNDQYIGSSFDVLLEEDASLAQVESIALKKVIVYELQKIMDENHITKREMAQRMHTSRSSLDRLLDPRHPNVTLETIERAAIALGKKVELSLQ